MHYSHLIVMKNDGSQLSSRTASGSSMVLYSSSLAVEFIINSP